MRAKSNTSTYQVHTVKNEAHVRASVLRPPGPTKPEDALHTGYALTPCCRLQIKTVAKRRGTYKHTKLLFQSLSCPLLKEAPNRVPFSPPMSSATTHAASTTVRTFGEEYVDFEIAVENELHQARYHLRTDHSPEGQRNDSLANPQRVHFEYPL